MKKLFYYGLNSFLYLLAKVIKKNSNIWLFSAWFGEKYADNSKYLFEYINKNHPEIRAVWISNNLTVVKQLNDQGYQAYKTYSLMGIYHGLLAKYSIFVHSNSSDCMMFLNTPKTKLVQLWHGIPLKKIGFDDTIYTSKKQASRIKTILFPFAYETFDLVIACSEEDRKNFSSAFKSHNVVITGYPRNDDLAKIKNKGLGYNIIYLPTFRNGMGSTLDLFSDYNFELSKWKEKLKITNITFYIKMHPVNLPTKNILETFSACENIVFLCDEDVADVLPKMDILITDYSSVYFDYLLTNNPIIFTPFDYDKYVSKDRQLYYNYSDVTPGPKCDDWGQVLEWIMRFKENNCLYADERKIAKNKFHQYHDSRSCERVFQEIKLLNYDNAK